MTFEIDINGRTRTVAVDRTEHGRYRVVVDGKAYDVDGVRVGNFGLSMVLDHDLGMSREMQVTPSGVPGELLVTVDGRVLSAAVNKRRTGGADAGGGVEGEQTIVAPMPGRVVRVLVAPGDNVAARQGVIVVEAMKMENELRSPKAGIVREIAVSPGMSVEAGRVLAVIE